MPPDVTPTIHRTSQFVIDAADLIVREMEVAIASRGLFRLALSGGNTPRKIHEELAARPQLPWEKVQFTFGDERCVPPDDADSNFHMAQESLFSRIPVPSGNIFRLRGEIPPEEAATEYEDKLRAVAGRLGEPIYRHDLILLGLGEDGHTASLFPGYPALDETSRWVVPTLGPKPPPQRLTLTYPVLNAARSIAFLVTPKGKEQVLEEVLTGDQRYPSARVQPTDGRVTWLIGV
jgi:6-phosphogluconolactonase